MTAVYPLTSVQLVFDQKYEKSASELIYIYTGVKTVRALVYPFKNSIKGIPVIGLGYLHKAVQAAVLGNRFHHNIHYAFYFVGVYDPTVCK